MSDHPVLTGLPDDMSEQAATAFNTLRGGPDWQISSHVTVPALSKAALFILVKDEADMIGQNLRHHYQLGFRRFLFSTITAQTAQQTSSCSSGRITRMLVSSARLIIRSPIIRHQK
ncbi:glycosyltransferase family 2 protein [Acetobacter cerevisiae]|uniref:glycosyltransferase family 2 protein n=1 Tax=Acetobacter cerevisiae TaxID=178900 RepID=UPI00209FE4BA|nr:glycosyltransferase family 2 protein [Acetobacter cerevisiae]MCP1271517.1 glycosyltransferase family 2 protein [Acetobacter cerevisiae]MCP1279471.1 glycosyltransferase family 2 protein [Acetobacter cerevisiae]